jgi:FixJ family two-component response regulator
MEVRSIAVHRRRVARVMASRRVEKLNAKAGASGNGNCVMALRSLVSVVDDDESVRESLPDLLNELGYETRAFSSAEDFLASDCVSDTECLVLDVAMPGMSGPELQQELTQRGQAIPIVFITARRDDAMRLRLIKQGAVECLFKPFGENALVAALNSAFGAS